MKKYIILLVLSVLAFSACQKENDEKKVTYLITGFADSYKVVYTYGDGSQTIVDSIRPGGKKDSIWTYNFSALPGEIAYIYVESDEDISNAMNFNTSILVDNKIIQKAVSYDKTKITPTDTSYFIKRSCTIPF